MNKKKIIFLCCLIICLLYSKINVKAAPYAGVTKHMNEIFKTVTYIQSNKYKVMYANTNVNIREKPNTKSDVIDILKYNESINVYKKVKNGWYLVEYKNKLAYIKSEYLSNDKKRYVEYNIQTPIYFKSYTDYRCITSTNSPQYRLQRQYAYTGTYGIRMVNDRFCVAIGSRFNCEIGQYFDIVLENGTIIKAIKTDEKADAHTDSTGTYTCVTGTYCATEFYVDNYYLNSKARNMGDLSYANSNWNSRVVAIRVYDEKIM